MTAVATIGRSTRPVGSPRRIGPSPRPVAGRADGRRVRPSAAVIRRRRIAVGVLVFVGLFGTARAAVALGGTSLTPEQPPAVAVSHTVEPGDTLWSIASVVAPDSDPRAVVDAIVKVRGEGPLIPGERITWGG